MTCQVFDAYRVSSHLDNIRLFTVVYKGTRQRQNLQIKIPDNKQKCKSCKKKQAPTTDGKNVSVKVLKGIKKVSKD